MPSSFFEDMWKTIQNGASWVGEIKNKKKNGDYYWIDAKIEPYYENDKHIGYSAIRIDITDKKKLQELNNTLEEKVIERSKKLEEKVLIDDLTNLKSHYSLLKDLNETKDSCFSVFMLINIDNFQNINNAYGYSIGNEVLIEISKMLESFANRRDYKLYRLYADEFALLRDFEFINVDSYFNDVKNLKNEFFNFRYEFGDIDEIIQLDATIGISFAQDKPLVTADMALRYAKKLSSF